jgi:hypothetical protein
MQQHSGSTKVPTPGTFKLDCNTVKYCGKQRGKAHPLPCLSSHQFRH